jgi:hypothetical protein
VLSINGNLVREATGIGRDRQEIEGSAGRRGGAASGRHPPRLSS